MELTVILGNGFDISLGLKTSYKDFYKYFLTKNQASYNLFEMAEGKVPSVHKELVEMMTDNSNMSLWSDLELLFGQKADIFSDYTTLNKEKAYLEKSLSEYLDGEQKRFIPNVDKRDELIGCLDKGIYFMLNSFGWDSLLAKGETINVHFLTFNYTDTIERLISIANKRFVGGKVNYLSPLYIHGRVGDNLILGVDSYGQYKIKKQFGMTEKEIEQYNDIMLKPAMNNELRKQILDNISRVIDNSDYVILYGSSMGKTDDYWWERLANWLISDTHNQYVHALGILKYMDDKDMASATARMLLKRIKDDWIIKVKKKCGENDRKYSLYDDAIRVLPCGKCVFNFDSGCVTLEKERLFAGLIAAD